ncbi:sugar phosphate isomerase/epimerase family protein [Pedosphaera parvula]|uniref:Xylose isomerase domain protein TIM barrel n=1 Tax=Pedosphaera parvula (strain Ellin514) TaxID=320771 RepID=B9XT50_PEDPL|nr:sugar phosphate isomerase/epimerase family protein [Pedosphaera parvula]EEF56985.1 Xylose isomerase domain protein TIM barrel [Pedosphaera parvula Ellin514]
MNSSFNRRDFLKLGGSALALASLTPASLVAEETAPARKRVLKKGLMFATVSGTASVMDKFKMIKDAGFDGVEPNSGMDRDEVLKARDATGLEIASVCDSVHWAKTLTDANPSVRAVGVEGLKTALQDAQKYGASSVLLVPGAVNKHVSYEDAYKRSQEEIRKALPMAEQCGVKIAIENVWNDFLLSPLEAARYVDEFNSPWVGWHFDIGNVIAYGFPEQWIQVLGKRIQKLHIKEYSRKKRDDEGRWKGFQVEYLEGDNNWPAVMKALDGVGYKGWAIAEPAWWPQGVELPVRLKQISEKMDKILAL